MRTTLILAIITILTGVVPCCIACADPESYEPPREQKGGVILKTAVLCEEPGRYIGWPSIAKAPNGDLLAVFSGDRSEHVSPDGKVQMVRSGDGGASWSAPVTVYDTPIDDRDSGILQTGKGTMIVSWFTGPYGGPWQGHWIVRSADNGHTWGEPIRTELTTPHGPIALKDGRLLYLGHRPHESHQQPFDVRIYESRDDGLTWQALGAFPVPGDVPTLSPEERRKLMLSYDECHAAECADGKIVVLFRDCNAQAMRQSESVDGGKTWAAPHVTALLGLPPHLIRLKNDWLLAVYAKRWEPFGEYACISKDNGATWRVEEEVLLAKAFSGDIGYPASVQLEDGTIWTVFYQAPQPGAKPCLMGTHWKMP
jgi:hypothetical protein